MSIWGAGGFELFLFRFIRSTVFGADGGLVASPLVFFKLAIDRLLKVLDFP